MATKLEAITTTVLTGFRKPEWPPLECGCAACRLKRAQQQTHENHSLSLGIFDRSWLSKPASDRSPRASLLNLERRGLPNPLAEINEKHRAFWAAKHGSEVN